MINEGVNEALKKRDESTFTCDASGCGYKTDNINHFITHKTGELGTAIDTLTEKVDAIEVPEAADMVDICKDGICTLIEETYNVTKKEEGEEKRLLDLR